MKPNIGLDFGKDPQPDPRIVDPGRLRDWFAGQALAGIAEHYSPEKAEHAALASYVFADAMLAARSK